VPGVHALAGAEEQDRQVANVKVNEVFGLVRHVRAKVFPDDAVPRRLVLAVKLLRDRERETASERASKRDR
jgi:hypothetical protein